MLRSLMLRTKTDYQIPLHLASSQLHPPLLGPALVVGLSERAIRTCVCGAPSCLAGAANRPESFFRFFV